MHQGAAELPLAGVRVLDLSRVLAGPMSTMVLGDLGADVIKVEHPGRGDDTRDWGIRIGQTDTSYYYAFNRNKRSVTLDLTTAEGVAAIHRLAAEADVMVENFKQGGMEKFGLGYDSLRAVNPRLVYCSIAGYDRSGPEAARPGYDLVIQGESGLMSINGDPDHPPVKFGVAAVDIVTGMYAAQAILAALFQAQRSGQGRRIDLALYDCGVSFSVYNGLDALLMGRDPARHGNAHPSIVPYGVFQAADGPFVLACGNNRQFRDLCLAVLDRPDLAQDGRFATNLLRSQNREALLPELDAAFGRLARSVVLARLSEMGIPCGEVLGLHEAMAGARTATAGLLQTHDHPEGDPVQFMVPPWRLDGHRLPVTAPPRLGEHDGDLTAEPVGWPARRG